MRGLWFTRWHIVCSSFFGSLTLLNIEMRDQLGFSGGKKKCEISWSGCIAYLSPSVLDWMCSHWRQTSYCHCGAVIWYCHREITVERLEKTFRCSLERGNLMVTQEYLNDSVYIEYICALLSCRSKEVKHDLFSLHTNIKQTVKTVITYCA